MNKELHLAEEEYQARLRQLPEKYKELKTLENLFGFLCRCAKAAGSAGEKWNVSFKEIMCAFEIHNEVQISDPLRESMYRGWAHGYAKWNGKNAEKHLTQRYYKKKLQNYLSRLEQGWHDNRERGGLVYKCAELAAGAGISLSQTLEQIMQIVESVESIDTDTQNHLIENIKRNYRRMKIKLNNNLSEFDKNREYFKFASPQKRSKKLNSLIHLVMRDGNSIENTIKIIFPVAKPFRYSHDEITDRVNKIHDYLSKQEHRFMREDLTLHQTEEDSIAAKVEENYLHQTEINRDKNESRIVARLRHLEAEVFCITPAERNSAGYPDLWVVYGGRGIHAEVKTQQGRLNEAQWRFQLHTKVARIRNVNHCDLLFNWLNSDEVELPPSLRISADEVEWR